MSVRKRHLEDEGLGSSCESDISDEPPSKPPPKKRPRSGGSRAGKKKDKVAAAHAGVGVPSIEDETGAKRKLVGITPVVRNGSAQWQAQLSHKVRAPRVRCRAFFGHRRLFQSPSLIGAIRGGEGDTARRCRGRPVASRGAPLISHARAPRRRLCARSRRQGTNYYLGTHPTAEAAARAYDAKARALGWHHKVRPRLPRRGAVLFPRRLLSRGRLRAPRAHYTLHGAPRCHETRGRRSRDTPTSRARVRTAQLPGGRDLARSTVGAARSSRAAAARRPAVRSPRRGAAARAPPPRLGAAAAARAPRPRARRTCARRRPRHPCRTARAWRTAAHARRGDRAARARADTRIAGGGAPGRGGARGAAGTRISPTTMIASRTTSSTTARRRRARRCRARRRRATTAAAPRAPPGGAYGRPPRAPTGVSRDGRALALARACDGRAVARAAAGAGAREGSERRAARRAHAAAVVRLLQRHAAPAARARRRGRRRRGGTRDAGSPMRPSYGDASQGQPAGLRTPPRHTPGGRPVPSHLSQPVFGRSASLCDTPPYLLGRQGPPNRSATHRSPCEPRYAQFLSMPHPAMSPLLG